MEAAPVRLLPGSPFHDRQELHRGGRLAALDPDRLLYPYRKLAGLPQPKGATGGYAGWDSGFLRGHMLGHYLSAASRMAVATGDGSFRAKVDPLVAELARCQAALGGSGYLAAFPEEVFDWLEGKGAENGGIVVPYYTIHKLMAGLLDAHRALGNRQALEVSTRMADWVQARLAALRPDAIETMLRTDRSRNPQNEFGAMGEVLAELSVVAGRPDLLDTARLFARPWFMAPLAAGRDELSGLHANCHIAQALGLARIAEVGGDAEAGEAAERFWRLLTREHAFVTGGNSFHEWLDAPGVEAGPSIDGGAVLPPTTGESCNTHNLLRLGAVLFARDQRIEYADHAERALCNHLLASIAPDTGAVTYFTPMHGHFRTYLDGTFCCDGSGLENTARYGEWISFQRDRSLWINLYVPSELTWDAAGLVLRLEGNAAAGEQVRVTVVRARGTGQATLHLRVPWWVSGPASVALNGVARDAPAPASYLSLARPWKAGDVVTLGLPASLRLERAKDVPSMVAIFLGPLLLAGELGAAGMPDDLADRDAHLGIPPAEVPAIVARGDPAGWLRPLPGSPLAFEVHGAGPADGTVFRPLYQVHHQRYSVYWPLRTA